MEKILQMFFEKLSDARVEEIDEEILDKIADWLEKHNEMHIRAYASRFRTINPLIIFPRSR